MISTQVLANCIEELHNITKVDLCVYDADGIEVVSTFDNEEVTGDMIRYFIASPADSQVIGIQSSFESIGRRRITVCVSRTWKW